MAERIVHYDVLRQRVWILGQRCHHGATGSLVAAGACLSLALAPVTQARRQAPRSMLALAAAGGALMIHDWKDRSLWFARDPAPRALEA